jgi:hypothetical protein
MLATNEMLAFDIRPAWYPWPPTMGSSNLTFPFDSDLIVFDTLSSGICELLSPDFMDVEFPLDEPILEAMILDFRSLPKIETLQVDYQKIPWLGPSNGSYLENYYE